GVIIAGISVYVQSTKQGNTVAIKSNKKDTKNSNPTSKNSSAQNNMVIDSAVKKANKGQEAPKNTLHNGEQQQLYAQNFVPDAPPKQRAELLEEAFKHYEK